MSRQTDTIRIGFIPLLDAAPVVAAAQMGFAAAHGLEIELVRETSWATIRDRLAVGYLDAAHILAPMPVAANLGLTPIPSPMVVPMTLGIGGNTVTVSNDLWARLAERGARPDFAPKPGAHALAAEVSDRSANGLPPLTFGIVHPYSAHHYVLAYWLAYAGILPGRDVELTVLPPSLMGAALAGGQIDGFCVGEPWGSLAWQDQAGTIVTTGSQIWRASPEKVLGVRSAWAEAHPDRLARLVRALYQACLWCDRTENRQELAALLSSADYLNQPEPVLHRTLSRLLPAADGSLRTFDDFLVFADKNATFPWPNHALWLYSQMARWEQVAHTEANMAAARATYRPELYREALAPLGVAVPAANGGAGHPPDRTAGEGSPEATLWQGPGGFFDGRGFDPGHVGAYIAGFDPATR